MEAAKLKGAIDEAASKDVVGEVLSALKVRLFLLPLSIYKPSRIEF